MGVISSWYPPGYEWWKQQLRIDRAAEPAGHQ
jgi:hypothetical protein